MIATFDDVLAANRAYASRFAHGDLPAPAAKGLGVLTCIDSRIEPLAMLGIGPGDAKIFRNAGARVTEDSTRSLVLAANLLEVRRIMIVIHTDCAMGGRSDDDVRSALRGCCDDASLDSFTPLATLDPRTQLRADVEQLRASPLLPSGVVVAGFEYDVRTGTLVQLVGD